MKKVFLAIALIPIAGVSFAQNWEWGMFPGIVSFPVAGMAKSWNPAPGLGLFAYHKFNSIFLLGFESSYYFRYESKYQSNSKMKLIQLTPSVRLEKDLEMLNKKFNLYAVFGGGAYSYKIAKTENNSTIVYSDESKIAVGFNAGMGLALYTAPEWKLGLDLRWHHISRSGNPINTLNIGVMGSYSF